MAIISYLKSRWILDSRGLPTLTCEIKLELNNKRASGQASVPSGASTGTWEALELRDGGTEFHGKGVKQAVNNVNTIIADKILNREFGNARELDEMILSLDLTENKSELGANAILVVSMAAHRAYASLSNLELWQYLRRLYFSSLPTSSRFPRLMCNVINGGAHADSGLSIQEFMVVPDTGEIEDDIRAASEIYHTLKKQLKIDNYSTSLGDEGGFAPHISTSGEVLDYLQKAIESSNYTLTNCGLAMDCAASEFYDKDKNVYNLDGQELTQTGLTNLYKELFEKYNLLSIEDGMAEDDILGWQVLTQSLGKKMHLIGDDLFVTNVKRFNDLGLDQKTANGVLIKLNQIGSVSETAEMINLAKENNYITAVSHRSGETTDSFISDLAFASQSEFIKLGAPARGERVAKYNRLLEIKDGFE